MGCGLPVQAPLAQLPEPLAEPVDAVPLLYPRRGAGWIGALSKPTLFEGVDNHEIRDLPLASCLGCLRRRKQIQTSLAVLSGVGCWLTCQMACWLGMSVTPARLGKAWPYTQGIITRPRFIGPLN